MTSAVLPSTGTPKTSRGRRAARSSKTPRMLSSRLTSAAVTRRSAAGVAPTMMTLGVSAPDRRRRRTSRNHVTCNALSRPLAARHQPTISRVICAAAAEGMKVANAAMDRPAAPTAPSTLKRWRCRRSLALRW